MKPFSLRGQTGAGFVSQARQPPHIHAARPAGRRCTVKASLRLAFALMLAGTLAIGMIALTQISRLNGVDGNDLHAGLRREPRRRGNARLSCCARAARRRCCSPRPRRRNAKNSARRSIEALADIGREQAQLQQYVDASDQDALAQQKRLATAVATWSGNLRAFVKLVKEQPLDLSQMNWQVGIQDVSLLVETGKLEKMVDDLVARRGAAAKSTIDAASFIYHSSFVMVSR